MSISVEVAKELLGMFLADARLTTATLVLVAIVACLAILVEAAVREARHRSAS